MVASSLHDVTLVGHHSSFFLLLLLLLFLFVCFILRHSFVDCMFCLGWQLSDRVFLAVADSIGIFSARLGVCIVFIIYALFGYCSSKIACVVRIRE